MGMPVINGSNITRCQAVTDIIQSVALEQAALAHILNAEGEKIQKILEPDTVSTQQILAVNAAVKSTINSIARLEMILHSKLALFEDCICTPCETPIPPPAP